MWSCVQMTVIQGGEEGEGEGGEWERGRGGEWEGRGDLKGGGGGRRN